MAWYLQKGRWWEDGASLHTFFQYFNGNISNWRHFLWWSRNNRIYQHFSFFFHFWVGFHYYIKLYLISKKVMFYELGNKKLYSLDPFQTHVPKTFSSLLHSHSSGTLYWVPGLYPLGYPIMLNELHIIVHFFFDALVSHFSNPFCLQALSF